IRSFGLINAVATRMSKAEAARLAAHPLVQAVVPDRVIRSVHKESGGISSAGGKAANSVAAGAGIAANAAAPNAAPAETALCPADPSKPLLEPEALQVTHTAFLDSTVPQAQQVLDGSGQPVTGKGVKVAYLADGVDPNNPDFIRSDGSHV